MEILATQDRDRAHLSISGSIDEEGAEELKRRFRQLDVPSLKEVVFNFGKVAYIGSAGLGKLLLFYKDVAAGGGSIKIENVSEPLYDLFTELKLQSLFTISKI